MAVLTDLLARVLGGRPEQYTALDSVLFHTAELLRTAALGRAGEPCGHLLARVGTEHGLCLREESIVWGVLASYQLQAWSPLSDVYHIARSVCAQCDASRTHERLMLRAEAEEGAPLFFF